MTRVTLSLSFTATALVVLICLRVAFGPTPEDWFHILAPMTLLTGLTLNLIDGPDRQPLTNIHQVGLGCALYIVFVATLGSLSTWHWSDQISLAALCLVTILLGLELSTTEAPTKL